MRIVYKEPGKDPEVRFVENNLESLQNLVQGWIEHVELSDGLGLIINEEGKLHDMEPNFYLFKMKDMILGPAVFVGEAGDEFTDISDSDLETVLLHFTRMD